MSDESFLWPIPERVPELHSDQVQAWAWDLDRQPKLIDWQLLDPEELQRARRFVYSQDRDRYVRAHAGMRCLLGSYARIEPRDVEFSKDACGKPRMIRPNHGEPSSRLFFNLSHTANVAVLALSARHEIGVDVEAENPRNAKVAERYFSTLELHTLGTLPPELWLRGFYRCWTGKEALLKGEGRGLSGSLHSFDIQADPRQPAALLAVRAQSPVHIDWQLLAVQPTVGVAGTIAIRHREQVALQCFTFPD
ncbi:MAG TPA: 4'-phosphopantetheinyl transferase superfamily protein [Acidobacteriaceae bacterium]|nr:4'-phosphopantetheinyl transferase superfamily protein [Acidobacteriaceae bacterium]